MAKENKKQKEERLKAEALIQENNLLIAKFMGGHDNGQGKWYNIGGRQRTGEPDSYGYHTKESLQYHKDWNWLMPVVAKAQELSGQMISMSWHIDKQYEIIISYINHYNSKN